MKMSIKVQDLQLLRNGRYVLRDVSAVFDKGKLHFCIGRNGSGKSSLLKCLAGIEPVNSPIEILGKPLSDLSAHKRAQMIAFVAQSQALYFEMSAWDYLLMGRFPYLNWLGNYTSTDHEIAQKYIDLLQLSPFLSQNIQTLSGGEFQKVAIARALIQETPILLLDEPAQSLDPYNKKWLYEFLPTLLEKEKTIICVSHDIEYLPKNALIWGLAEGKLVWKGLMGEKKEEMWETVFTPPPQS